MTNGRSATLYLELWSKPSLVTQEKRLQKEDLSIRDRRHETQKRFLQRTPSQFCRACCPQRYPSPNRGGGNQAIFWIITFIEVGDRIVVGIEAPRVEVNTTLTFIVDLLEPL